MKDRASSVGLASVAGGLVALYVLSPPFVAWMCITSGFDEAEPVFAILYAPLVMLYENFPPYKALMDMLFKFLVP